MNKKKSASFRHYVTLGELDRPANKASVKFSDEEHEFIDAAVARGLYPTEVQRMFFRKFSKDIGLETIRKHKRNHENQQPE